MSVFIIIMIKTRLNFTSNFLDQNNPKSKYQCQNELIYIRDFEAIQKTHSRVLSGLKTCLHLKFLNLIIHSCYVRGDKRNRQQGGHAATPAVTSLINLMNASLAPSSETQGQSVGSGEKVRRQFSSTRLTAPGFPRVVWPTPLTL